MASLLDHEPGECRTPAFRRGFVHGAQVLFDVAGGLPSEEQALLLRDELNRWVRSWPRGPGEAEAPPPANSLLPP
ncbi:hypothetical protein D8770_22900 [Methylobacterium sp. DB1607]|nr:hypothetical protein [Methylobacterium sp. DB1607]